MPRKAAKSAIHPILPGIPVAMPQTSTIKTVQMAPRKDEQIPSCQAYIHKLQAHLLTSSKPWRRLRNHIIKLNSQDSHNFLNDPDLVDACRQELSLLLNIYISKHKNKSDTTMDLILLALNTPESYLGLKYCPNTIWPQNIRSKIWSNATLKINCDHPNNDSEDNISSSQTLFDQYIYC